MLIIYHSNVPLIVFHWEPNDCYRATQDFQQVKMVKTNALM